MLVLSFEMVYLLLYAKRSLELKFTIYHNKPVTIASDSYCVQTWPKHVYSHRE